VAGRLSNSRYNELALTQGCEIGSAAAADVLVLKGAAWGSSNGALHRSPPLRNGEARLLLSLDVNENEST